MIPQKYTPTEYSCHKEIDRLREKLAKAQELIDKCRKEKNNIIYVSELVKALKGASESQSALKESMRNDRR